MKPITSSHNPKSLSPRPSLNRTCNCVGKEKYPLSLINGSIIYKVVLASINPHCKEKICFSTAETTLKLQYSNHQRSFKFLKHKADTELSGEVWQMKKSRQILVITWEIVRKYSP